MKFTFAHNNYNVKDLDKSLQFYKDALGLVETRRFHAPDGSFTPDGYWLEIVPSK